jgi:hypothetical protein
MMMSASLKAALAPSLGGRKPLTFCNVSAYQTFSISANSTQSAAYRVGRDVRQIGRDTGGVDDIVERELVNEGRELQEQREGLSKSVSHYYQSADIVPLKRPTWPMPPAAPATTVAKLGPLFF